MPGYRETPGVLHLVTTNIPLETEFSREHGGMIWERPDRQSARRT